MSKSPDVPPKKLLPGVEEQEDHITSAREILEKTRKAVDKLRRTVLSGVFGALKGTVEKK
jgi:hypothetical protein